MSDSDDDQIDTPDIRPGMYVEAFELPPIKPHKWVKEPTHIPAKRPVKLYSFELHDPTLRIVAGAAPFKNTLN